jgi:hypothetical protein
MARLPLRHRVRSLSCCVSSRSSLVALHDGARNAAARAVIGAEARALARLGLDDGAGGGGDGGGS